jgi:TonB-dependent SusC/RagA subfamily outer membrane receptor
VKNLLLVLIALFLFSLPQADAQKAKNVTISGRVVDGNNNPVAGAAIFIDNKKTDIVTNQNGSYRIKIKQGAEEILVLSILSGASEQKIEGRTEINFVLSGEAGGTTPAQESSKSLNIKDSAVPVYQDIYDMIRGRIAGVEVSGKSIKIRGSNSLNVSTEPLFVVDGVITEDIDGISPESVSKIEVLKGPDASVYGTRGSNGVIIITRRTGKE